MPVLGTKPQATKRRKNQPIHEWVEVPGVEFRGGPVAEKSWPALTKRWWGVISRMPHCVLWTESDWQFAKDTAIIAAAFHGGLVGQAVELRLREKVMGTTMDARRDLRIRYVEVVEEEKPQSVTAIADYKRRLA